MQWDTQVMAGDMEIKAKIRKITNNHLLKKAVWDCGFEREVEYMSKSLIGLILVGIGIII